MTVSYEVAGQKRPVTCPKLPRFPAHLAAAKKSDGERVNVEDLIIKIDVTTGREQRAARRRFEQYARGIGPGQDLHRVRPLRSTHRYLRDGSREVHLPRVQVRAVALCLGLTNGV